MFRYGRRTSPTLGEHLSHTVCLGQDVFSVAYSWLLFLFVLDLFFFFFLINVDVCCPCVCLVSLEARRGVGVRPIETGITHI